MITFDESVRILAEAAKPLAAETIPLHEADGRVLAEAVVASHSSPAFPASAMDGYAVRDRDLRDLPVALTVIGKSFAGTPFQGPLPPDSCVRVFTGAQVPEGTDRVVIQEEVKQDGEMARFVAQPGASRHIRPTGSDFASGDVLLEAGTALTPQRLVAAAASGQTTVAVIRQPRVIVISCGDELVPCGAPGAAEGKTPDSISLAVGALTRRWQGTIADRWLRGDDLAILEQTAAEALALADVVVVTGGASVGERDYAKAMFAPHGLHLLFNKVAIRPGKPVWLGTAGKTLIVGLPGNPTSALVTARLYLAPLLAGLAGFDPASAWAWQSLPLKAALLPGGERENFLRAAAISGSLVPLRNQDSAAQKILADATHLIRQPSGSPATRAGDHVRALPF